jgi:hypothetical protein
MIHIPMIDNTPKLAELSEFVIKASRLLGFQGLRDLG